MPAYQFDYSLASDLWRTLDKFTQGYIEAAMWTLTDDDGESCDHLGLHDIADSTIAAMKADCAAFQEANREDLEAYGDHMQKVIHNTDGYAGHDFWLTRNGHGVGYWDRGLGDLGQRLTAASKVYGNVDLYVGDDNMVYC